MGQQKNRIDGHLVFISHGFFRQQPQLARERYHVFSTWRLPCENVAKLCLIELGLIQGSKLNSLRETIYTKYEWLYMNFQSILKFLLEKITYLI